MVNDATTDELRRWRLLATEGLAASIETAPDVTVPAYPHWTVRHLALHVVRIYGIAEMTLESGALERPHPELRVAIDDEAATLADAVRRALHEAETAIERCRGDAVWTPVGPRRPAFWARRLLREAALHRWDAEDARGAAAVPDQEQSLELIDEFLDTDFERALTEGDGRLPGVVTIRSAERVWRVSLSDGSVDREARDKAATTTISGDPPAVWLWLMRRDSLPGPVSIDDVDGGGKRFTDLIERFHRPTR